VETTDEGGSRDVEVDLMADIPATRMTYTSNNFAPAKPTYDLSSSVEEDE
jgi:DNA-directed RNA polymerase subunit beta